MMLLGRVRFGEKYPLVPYTASELENMRDRINMLLTKQF